MEEEPGTKGRTWPLPSDQRGVRQRRAPVPISSTCSLGVERGKLQWEMVGLTGGKGPTAGPGWGLTAQSQPLP